MTGPCGKTALVTVAALWVEVYSVVGVVADLAATVVEEQGPKGPMSTSTSRLLVFPVLEVLRPSCTCPLRTAPGQARSPRYSDQSCSSLLLFGGDLQYPVYLHNMFLTVVFSERAPWSCTGWSWTWWTAAPPGAVAAVRGSPGLLRLKSYSPSQWLEPGPRRSF